VEALETRALLAAVVPATVTTFSGPRPAAALEASGTPMVFTVSINTPNTVATRFLIALKGTATSPDVATGLPAPGTDYSVTDAAGLPMLPILDVLPPNPCFVPGAVGSYPIKPVIDAGSLSTTFTITPINDAMVELDETVIATVLNVTTPGGVKLNQPAVTTGTATITNDDKATFSISGAPTVAEGGA